MTRSLARRLPHTGDQAKRFAQKSIISVPLRQQQRHRRRRARPAYRSTHHPPSVRRSVRPSIYRRCLRPQTRCNKTNKGSTNIGVPPTRGGSLRRERRPNVSTSPSVCVRERDRESRRAIVRLYLAARSRSVAKRQPLSLVAECSGDQCREQTQYRQGRCRPNYFGVAYFSGVLDARRSARTAIDPS